MVGSQTFNLEKIKEITSPIEELQGNLKKLEDFYEILTNNKNKITQVFTDKFFFEQSQEITKKLTDIYNKLIKISNENILNFLIFQDNLIKKYKNPYKEKINSLKLGQSYLSFEIGLFLIKNKQVSKIIEQSSFILTVPSNQWKLLLNSLKQNSRFISTINKIEKFIEAEQLKVTKKEIKEKEELEDLKNLKEKQPPDYELNNFLKSEYLKYSKAEFDRRRRREKREKLGDLQKKPETEVDIPQDIYEKINKFKSKFGSDFKQKYFIQEDETINPLDLIRKRKRRKEEEYKDHIQKLKNKDEK